MELKAGGKNGTLDLLNVELRLLLEMKQDWRITQLKMVS